MSPRDYCFWLRGAYELSNPDLTALTSEKSLAEMRSHLSLVLADTDQDYRDTYPDDCLGMDFCKWLNTWLKNADSHLSLAQLAEVDAKLTQVFMSEIDPAFSNGELLQMIHDG